MAGTGAGVGKLGRWPHLNSPSYTVTDVVPVIAPSGKEGYKKHSDPSTTHGTSPVLGVVVALMSGEGRADQFGREYDQQGRLLFSGAADRT